MTYLITASKNYIQNQPQHQQQYVPVQFKPLTTASVTPDTVNSLIAAHVRAAQAYTESVDYKRRCSEQEDIRVYEQHHSKQHPYSVAAYGLLDLYA